MLVARSVVLNNTNIVGRMMEQQQQQQQQDDDGGGDVVVGVVKIEGGDVEEGEISDSASVEEISADDFNRQDEEVVKAVVVVNPKETSTAPMKPKVGSGDTRVWTMQDLFSQYPMSRGYATGLYNFAWAQAVQNKPLNEVYVMDVDDSDESSKRVSSTSSSAAVDATTSSSGKEEGIVINVDSGDDEMEDVNIEEGELEEGEIDMDSEPAAADGGVGISNVDLKIDSEDGEEEDLEKQVNSIREALEGVCVVEADKSFNAVCSRLQSTLETLQVVLKNIVPTKDALIQLSFSGIQALDSVFRSFNSIQKEQNKQIFSRLISVVINQDPPIFPSERMKEIEAMVPVVNSSAVLSSAEGYYKEKDKLLSDELNHHDSASSAHNVGQNVNSAKMFGLDSLANQLSSNKIDINMLSEASKPGLSSLRARGAVAPLLDLHKDHDSDSLPSPTRENQPYFLLRNSLAVGEGMPKPESATTFKSLATREEMPKPEPVTTFKSLMAVGEGMPKPESVTAFKSLAVGEGMPKSESVAAFNPEYATAPVDHKKVDGSMMHHYETEAVKAVSTYQQKFGRASFLSNDRLPSPTPSDESVDKGDDDMTGEVSSSYDVANFKNSKRPISGRPISSPAPHMNSTSVQGMISASDAGPVSSVTNSTLKASAKSRDPRIRFATSTGGALKINQHTLPVVSITPNLDPFGGTIKSRRNKNVEDPMLDGPAYKRQRNGSTDSDLARDAKTVSGSGGWLEDAGTVGPKFVNRNHLTECTSNDLSKVDVGVTYPSTASNPSIVTSGIEQVPLNGTNTISTTPPIPALFKDIVVNPTMLLNLLKMGQEQRLSAEVQQKPADPTINSTHPPISNSQSGAVPLANVTSLKPLTLSQSLAGTLQVPSQGGPMNLQDDVAKIRMKPRDPRRFLHSNTIQNSTEQLKTNGAPTLSSQGNKENVNSQKLEDQADTNSTSSQSVAPPDIARQFTKNLKNIADLMSFPPTTVSSSVVSQSSLIVPVQPTSDKVDAKDVKSESDERQSGTASLPGESVAGPLKSQNTWGDVEHLFEGFDDQQKAAIQRERARRLEEQKKMFAARKLCLVLDLDHTLLNSAKFVEVDPVHDEILRKKEEQDREKPHRHLFRFPYMGMWTKLRPGVWNFLEKASRLFELHLYTMGNKLYATEMAKVLDPKGDLFAGRVISRGDDGDLIDGDERIHKSKDLEGVLGMESAVVIIDDSVRVWPHNKLNLIVVERYTYFPCSRRQFGLPGPSLLEIDHDERPEDGTLASCSTVIEKIHQNFFSHRSLDEVDVRNILASEQRKILAGCRILFSRVFPVGEANPHLHPLWQTAEQFGAVCTNQIDEQVTHVVANSLGTDKVNWALSTGRFVVHPGWVEASALLYRRVNEQDFAIKQ